MHCALFVSVNCPGELQVFGHDFIGKPDIDFIARLHASHELYEDGSEHVHFGPAPVCVIDVSPGCITQQANVFVRRRRELQQGIRNVCLAGFDYAQAGFREYRFVWRFFAPLLERFRCDVAEAEESVDYPGEVFSHLDWRTAEVGLAARILPLTGRLLTCVDTLKILRLIQLYSYPRISSIPSKSIFSLVGVIDCMNRA